MWGALFALEPFESSVPHTFILLFQSHVLQARLNFFEKSNKDATHPLISKDKVRNLPISPFCGPPFALGLAPHALGAALSLLRAPLFALGATTKVLRATPKVLRATSNALFVGQKVLRGAASLIFGIREGLQKLFSP